MLSLFSSEKLCVDIRGRVLKYTQSKMNKWTKKVEIKKYGSICFDDRHLQHGILCESSETVKVITNFLKREKISAREVLVNISDPSIVLRLVKVPMMSEKDLKDYLQMEISQYLPVDFDTNTYDYKVLGVVEEEDRKFLSLMLTSVPRELIQNYVNLFRKAGLFPRVVDVYPNSMARIFGMENDRDIAVVDVNQNTVDFVILEKGKLFMYSNVSIENYDLPGTDKKLDIDSLLEEDLAFSASLDEVINYVRTYINFYSSRHFGRNVDVIYFLGDMALIKGIQDHLSRTLQIEVRLELPEFYMLDNSYNIFDYKRNREVSKRITMYSCSLGLALRSV